MRPMESDGDHFLSYYLTQKDDDAIEFKQNRVQHMQESLAENFDDDEVGKPVSLGPSAPESMLRYIFR